jgi:hypothetical protein
MIPFFLNHKAISLPEADIIISIYTGLQGLPFRGLSSPIFTSHLGCTTFDQRQHSIQTGMMSGTKSLACWVAWSQLVTLV